MWGVVMVGRELRAGSRRLVGPPVPERHQGFRKTGRRIGDGRADGLPHARRRRGAFATGWVRRTAATVVWDAVARTCGRGVVGGVVGRVGCGVANGVVGRREGRAVACGLVRVAAGGGAWCRRHLWAAPRLVAVGRRTWRSGSPDGDSFPSWLVFGDCTFAYLERRSGLADLTSCDRTAELQTKSV